jgi:hypothetical protein
MVFVGTIVTNGTCVCVCVCCYKNKYGYKDREDSSVDSSCCKWRQWYTTHSKVGWICKFVHWR